MLSKNSRKFPINVLAPNEFKNIVRISKNILSSSNKQILVSGK
jgi:hypothetical protein